MDYTGPERRAGLSAEQIESIAELAATKALERVYSQIGKGVMQKAAWVIGAAVVAILIWLGKNNIPLK